jgi:hypothetical protein
MKQSPSTIAAEISRGYSARPRKVFLGLPHHDNRCSMGMAVSLLFASREHVVTPYPCGRSLLASNFNIILCRARDAAKFKGYTDFAMLHSDVGPLQQNWLDVLLGELDAYDADVVSACVPIKNDSGDVSVAVETDDPYRPRRLNVKDLARLPETFGTADVGGTLLVNTGCMVVNLRKPWVTALSDQGEAAMTFTIRDRVRPNVQGGWDVDCDPEDWGMSRTLAALGCKVLATTKVRPIHYGHGEWRVPELVTEAVDTASTG